MKNILFIFVTIMMIIAVYPGNLQGQSSLIQNRIYDNTDTLEDTLSAVSAQTQTNIRIASTTEDFNQAAASYTLFTGGTADVILESIELINATVDCSDDASFTGISIQTDDVTPTYFITQANGVKANLTSEAQIAWTGSAIIRTGTIIKMTIYGAASDATCAAIVKATYRSPGTGVLTP